METNRKHPFFWIALLLAGVIASLYISAATVIHQYGRLDKDLGWEYTVVGKKCFVLTVDPNGFAVGKLQKGDQIVTINGRAPVSESKIMGLSNLSFSGEFYDLRIARDGVESDLQIRAKIEKTSKNLFAVLVPVAASLVIFVIALAIALAKPQERFTQLFTITWFSVALVYLAIGLDPIRDLFGKSEMSLYMLIWTLSFAPMEAATAYHFCYRFPPGVPENRFWSAIRNVLYICVGLVAIVSTVIRVAILQRFEKALQFLSTHSGILRAVERSSDILMVLSLLCISALIVRNNVRIQDVNQRRRLRWVVCGTLIGIFPSILFFAASFAFSIFQLKSGLTIQCLDFLMLTSDLFLMLVPLSIGFAIIKHRMFDIHVVVRQGLRYLLAKNVLRILLYLPAVIIIYTIVKNRDQNITQLLFSNTTYIILTVAALIGLKFRNQFADWLDRKFFREAYDSEKILVSLIDEIKNLNSISEISKWVTLQLDSALHPKQILVFYRRKEKGDLALGYSSGEHSQNLHIPSDSGLVRIFTDSGSSQKFPSKETSGLPEQEKEWLQQLGTHLIVPMNDSDQRLAGMLLLGEKKSEEPYTATDLKMLEALAGQISIVCENLLLKEHVDQEMKIKRNVLSHLDGQKRNLLRECPECGRCYDPTVLNCEADQSELILTLPVDRTVDGKYQLDKLLGRGGMGAVYQATDLRLRREVAVKISIGSMFGDRLALRRFEREARASAKLSHPNVVSVYDFGDIDGEGAYLVMELIHGFTLRFFLKQNGNAPPRVAADWMNQILEGMKAAHQNGIVHRDLKPENILITRNSDNESLVKILDFGLAKIKFLDAAESKNLTAPGTIVGTLSYMSPEQIMGGELDERTDVYSIGVMAIEALTGQPPFTGKTSSDIALAIISKPFELSGDASEIRALNDVLQKSIAKNPKERFGSLAELQKDLIEAMRNVSAFPSPLSKSLDTGSRAQTRIEI